MWPFLACFPGENGLLWRFCSRSAHLVVLFGTAGPAHSIVWKVVELVTLLAFGFLLRSSAHIMHTAGYIDAYILLVGAFLGIDSWNTTKVRSQHADAHQA